MKQSRRQELKTNELSVFLKDTYASILRNLNYVIGGVLVVAALLAIGLYVRHRQQVTRDQAFKAFAELDQKSVVEDPSVLDKMRDLAAKEQGNKELGPQVALAAADKADELAISLDPAKDRDRQLKLWQDARDRYQSAISQYVDQPANVSRARFSLAKVEESLLLAGEGKKEQVRSLYEQLAKDPVYGSLATDQLKTLDERLQPLKVVATRPAEPPATAPAELTTTQPSTEPGAEATGAQPKPAPFVVPPPPTQPAVPPTTAPAQ